MKQRRGDCSSKRASAIICASSRSFLASLSASLGQQHSFLIWAILYLSKVAVESVFTRHFLMLNLERNNALQKVLSESSNMQNVLQVQVDCNGLWDMIWSTGALGMWWCFWHLQTAQPAQEGEHFKMCPHYPKNQGAAAKSEVLVKTKWAKLSGRSRGWSSSCTNGWKCQACSAASPLLRAGRAGSVQVALCPSSLLGDFAKETWEKPCHNFPDHQFWGWLHLCFISG